MRKEADVSGNNVTIRELFRHLKLNPSAPYELRKVLGFKDDKLTLRNRATPFSLMTQNTALITVGYDGTDRGGVVGKLIERIRALSPDVVGLCELFDDDQREHIRNSVKNIYPFFMEGPDTDNPREDGGCLLLSKHEPRATNAMIYIASDGTDSLANKGALHMRIWPPGAPHPFEIFYTHTEDIDGGVPELYAQLTELNAFINGVADPDNPAFIFGDINIPGEMPIHYAQLMSRLNNPTDLWLAAGHSPERGFTFASDNNFYEDPDDNPHLNQRLDYVLMRPGRKLVPIINDIEILKFKLNGRDISDHFGLRATFQQSIELRF